MNRLIAPALCLALATGCGAAGADAFRTGVPTTSNVNLSLPGQAGQPLTGDTGSMSDPLQGQTSNFYRLTRDVTGTVNGGVVLILGTVRAITRIRPTSLSGQTAVWGPYTPDLSPITWKLTVTHTEGQTYTYTLEGKAKGDPDTAYQVVLSGTHTRAVDAKGNAIADYGQGTFLLDWDARAKLPDAKANLTGTAEVDYARPAPGQDTTIDVSFTGATDARSGRKLNAKYTYQHTPNVGGKFTFVADSDVDGDGTNETLAIESRWQHSGTGRSDVKATGGDMASGGATINECWDDNFASTFMAASFSTNPKYNYGDEASGCAFASAEYAPAQP